MGLRDFFTPWQPPPPIETVELADGQKIARPIPNWTRKDEKKLQRNRRPIPDYPIPDFKIDHDGNERRVNPDTYVPPMNQEGHGSGGGSMHGSRPRAPSMPFNQPHFQHHGPQSPWLQAGAAMPPPPVQHSQGLSMQAQHGSRPHGGISRHDFADQVPNHSPQPHHNQGHYQSSHPVAPVPMGGKFKEGEPLPTGVFDPFATQGEPKPKGHYGMFQHFTGLSKLDVGDRDLGDPAAIRSMMSERVRLEARQRGQGGHGGRMDARASTYDPRFRDDGRSRRGRGAGK
ncbi:hypothetical protein EK21DRAFT_110986 [Setomelanomma holmii]|uniref:Uncharacterized protein n=1 Tax=Setomelanomma holmii TaxID=210430 RepID=A0A9P4HB32_9PLEO|nr:hypothetical protein EK21DRAFT_110986 [Setomelanomma holmii]